MEKCRQWVESVWYPNPHQEPLYVRALRYCAVAILIPFSFLYALISLLIQFVTAVQHKLGLGYRAPVPVIVVGNVTVGGTGKTPLVATLCTQFMKNGLRPGIVSRGYGRKSTGILLVREPLHPAEVGDEAVLLHRLTGCPMVVGADRNQAIQLLLRHYPDIDIIMSDDGLQHAALQAHIRILMLDASRNCGNGWCLPAGPLRAPLHIGRFSQADFVVVNGQMASLSHPQPRYTMQLVPVGFCKLIPGESYQLSRPVVPVAEFIANHHAKTVHAIAGIGNPERFFHTLSTLGLTVIPHAYPDHHHFNEEALCFNSEETVIMTEKDAVKCSLKNIQGDCWALKVRATIEESFFTTLIQRIQNLDVSRQE